MTELFDASASMRLESMKIFVPSTNPAFTHCTTIRSKKEGTKGTSYSPPVNHKVH
jgi:hypothetical protein